MKSEEIRNPKGCVRNPVPHTPKKPRATRPETWPCGAPFGHELETVIDHGALGARGGIWCAVGRLCDAP